MMFYLQCEVILISENADGKEGCSFATYYIKKTGEDALVMTSASEIT